MYSSLIMEIENDRIVASLTVGEYKEVLNSVLGEKLKEKDGPHEFGFGLKCIQDHFGVSKGTAQTYKDTFLKTAIMQHGRKIKVDLTLADQLYDHRHNYNKGIYHGDGAFK